jgi:hypothetical protein
MITTTKQAHIVLEQLRQELPKGSPAWAVVVDVIDHECHAHSAEMLFARLMIDHGYPFEDALAAFEAVRKIEK